MNKILLFVILTLSVTTSVVHGFAVGGMNGGSSFAAAQRFTESRVQTNFRRGDVQMMGGKMAKFGIFSPAVYVAKIVLGEEKLNKLRGKGISLHSQAIGDFCTWVGAYHLRTKLIKTAKTNGDILGFLV